MSAPEQIDSPNWRALEPDFAAIFASLPEPHLVLTPDLIMVEANDARIAATGVARPDFVGRHIFDVFPDNPDEPDATGVANLRASVERVLRHKVPDTMAVQKYDIPREGGGFEERYWLPFNFPVLSRSGEVLWIVHRVEDVTDAVRREHATKQAAAGQDSLIAKLQRANQKLSFEMGERTKAQLALHQSESWLRLLLDTAADGVYAVDRAGIAILCNTAFCSMLGFRGEEEALGLNIHDVIHSKRPDGSHYPHEACPIYKAAQSGEPAHVLGETFQRLDGTLFPVEYWARPIWRDGELQGAVCTFVDITERQHAQEQQELLVRELDHRVKNLFSIVTAMVALSARSAGSVREMAEDIKGRILALAAAHELARPRGSDTNGTTEVRDLIEKVLTPHVQHEERVFLSGPSVQLSSPQATGMALILHELATNAVKYGAFSNSTGTTDITWLLSSGTLTLQWAEVGGAPVTGPPERKGFGTILSQRTATATLRGEITYNWLPQGLEVHLSIPLAG